MEHKTKNIVLKSANVDLKIIPLIEWLNAKEGVHTLYSCECNDNDNKPYIMWSCSYPPSLVWILHVFSPFATTEIDYYEGSLRYTSRFGDENSLKMCMGLL